MTVSFSQRVSVRPDVLMQTLGDESVYLQLSRQRYFGLDASGTSMWKALTNSRTIQAAYDNLLSQYEVEPQRLRDDLLTLIEELVEHDLVEISN